MLTDKMIKAIEDSGWHYVSYDDGTAIVKLADDYEYDYPFQQVEWLVGKSQDDRDFYESVKTFLENMVSDPDQWYEVHCNEGDGSDEPMDLAYAEIVDALQELERTMFYALTDDEWE